MNKLFGGFLALCAVMVGIIVVYAAVTLFTGRSTEVPDQSPKGLLHRRIRAGKSIEEIRRIAKEEAKKEVVRVARRRKAEAAEAKRKFKEEQRRLLEEARKKWEAEWNSLKPEERQLLDELNEAMCEDDLETISFAAEELAQNPNPIIRRAAVEAISWFGDKGLADMAVFLVDGDEEVAELAKERWSLGVQEVEDEQEKATLAKLGMLYVKDEDSLNTFMGDLTMVDDDLKVMQVLVDLIEEGTPESAAVAREQYEWMTGDEYRGVDYADLWLQENYEPPEEDEPEEAEPEEAEQEEAGQEEVDEAAEGEQV